MSTLPPPYWEPCADLQDIYDDPDSLCVRCLCKQAEHIPVLTIKPTSEGIYVCPTATFKGAPK